MKKLMLCLALLMSGGVVLGQEPAAAPQTKMSAEGGFYEFEYQGFGIMVPTASQASVSGSEAVLKCADGTFGMSVKVEKDRGASADSALEMCRRMVSEFGVEGARITKMLIHGMQGVRLEGITEGLPVTVQIMAVDGRYLRIVAMSTPAHADWVGVALDSVTRLF